MKVEFYRHQLGADEAESFRKVLDTLFLTLGPQVAAWEAELGAYLVRGTERTPLHCVGTNSCSMGLLLALRALGLSPGDEVITTPMTFAATANAILHAGARPVFVDVEPETGLIDVESVRAAIGPRTVGILPVHLYGQLCDMRALRALADRHNLFIVEDSAHGVEMERDSVRPGELGDCAVFSFYATKNLTSGDGGAIATRRADLADRAKRLRNHGVSRAATDRHGGVYVHWDLVELGYKANLTDLDAALLRPQLPKAAAKRDQRQALVERYESAFRDLETSASPCGVPPMIGRRGTSAHHLFTLHADKERRDSILASLGTLGVGTAVNYRAIHTLTYLAELFRLPMGSFPVAEEMGQRTLSLPLYPTLSRAEQDYVIDAVQKAWSAL